MLGLALGSHQYPLALALYGITLGSLWLLRYVEPLLPRETFRQMVLHMHGDGMSLDEARECFARHRLAWDRVTIARDKQARTATYTFVLRGKRQEAFVAAFNALLQREDVHYGQLLQQEWQGAKAVHDPEND